MLGCRLLQSTIQIRGSWRGRESVGQVVAECLHPFRGLSKLIPRGTGFRFTMEFGRGLVMHGRDVYQYGVMTGTPTPAQEMKEGVRAGTP